MSEVYCRTCDDDENGADGPDMRDNFDSPACLVHVTGNGPGGGLGAKPKNRNLLSIESELELPNGKGKSLLIAPTSPIKVITSRDKSYKSLKVGESPKKEVPTESQTNQANNNKKPTPEEYELADDATGFDGELSDDHVARINVLNEADEKRLIRVHGKEELPAEQQTSPDSPSLRSPKYRYFDKNDLLNEIAHLKEESILIDNIDKQPNIPSNSNPGQSVDVSNDDDPAAASLHTIRDNTPATKETKSVNSTSRSKNSIGLEKSTSASNIKAKASYVNCTNDHPLMDDTKCEDNQIDDVNVDYLNGNATDSVTKQPLLKRLNRLYSTLPRVKKTVLQHMMGGGRPMKKVPTRITPDGTTIYYWCDLSKQAVKGYYISLLIQNAV